MGKSPYRTAGWWVWGNGRSRSQACCLVLKGLLVASPQFIRQQFQIQMKDFWGILIPEILGSFVALIQGRGMHAPTIIMLWVAIQSGLTIMDGVFP
jgi:hypothetical protein